MQFEFEFRWLVGWLVGLIDWIGSMNGWIGLSDR